jgi:hypothetical protein
MKKIFYFFMILLKSIYSYLLIFCQKVLLEKDKNFFLKNFNKQDFFIVFIECGSHPINFNYTEYLLNAKLLSQGRKIILVILPELHFKKYKKDIFVFSSNELRFDTILYPLINLIEDFNPSVIISKSRNEAIDYFNFPKESKFPSDASYEKINYNSFTVKELYYSINKYGERPVINPKNQYDQLLNNLIFKDKNYKIITISLRYCSGIKKNTNYNFYRNSNLKVWLDVADWIKNETEYLPIIIPDFEQLELESKNFGGHQILKIASINLSIRAALYKKAFLNLSITAGFSELLFHSNFSFLNFKFGDSRIESDYPNSIKINEETYGIKRNDQLPFLRKNQKIFWGEETENFDFIKEKIIEFINSKN